MKVLAADYDRMVEMLTPLGLYKRRVNLLKGFSRDFMWKKWTRISDLHGIGQYASDSYEIFVNNNIKIKPTDKVLQKYLKWRKQIENEKRATGKTYK